jgi:hypothetical protein
MDTRQTDILIAPGTSKHLQMLQHMEIVTC